MSVETIALKAEKREKVGTKTAEKLRQAGKLPIAIYGHGQEPVAVAVDKHDFIEALHHGNRLFDFEIAGKSEKLLVKDLQYDYLGREVIHADLVRVDLTETVKVEVPIELKGTAKGTSQGGIVEELMSQLEVQCVVTSIPESIVVNIKDLDVEGVIHAGDIKMPEGVKLLTPGDQIVLTCHVIVAKEEEEVSEEPTAPEVITERKPKEETPE